MITPTSFTENDSLDKLVLAFIIFRIIVSAVISAISAVQAFYEVKYQHWNNVINPRFLVLVGISLFLALRIAYSIVYIETKDQGYASATVFVRMFVTFFTLQSWIFIGSFWMQLLFTLYISKRIRVENSKKIFRYSLLILGGCFIFTLGNIFVAIYAPSIADKYFTIGFLIILVILGSMYASFGLILSRLMTRSKKRSKAPPKVVFSIKFLACVSIALVIAVLIRDLMFAVVLKIPINNNLRHLSNFLSFFFEITEAIVEMIAIAEIPKHYLLLRPINPSVVKAFKYPHQQRGHASSTSSPNHQSSQSSQSSQPQSSSSFIGNQRNKNKKSSSSSDPTSSTSSSSGGGSSSNDETTPSIKVGKQRAKNNSSKQQQQQQHQQHLQNDTNAPSKESIVLTENVIEMQPLGSSATYEQDNNTNSHHHHNDSVTITSVSTSTTTTNNIEIDHNKSDNV